MCGIIGVFNHKEAQSIVDNGLKVMINRGLDYSNSCVISDGILGHNLHAIVNLVKQPLEFEGEYLIANCEIYNWKDLNTKYNLDAKNDAELLLRFLSLKKEEHIATVLDELDGVYAFSWCHDGKVILARDIIGVKPLWFSFSHFFSFASEKKALFASDIFDVTDLNPRKIIEYNIKENRLKYINRDFFVVTPEHNQQTQEIKKELYPLLEDAIKKRLTNKKVGLLFSGGIDSVFIAYVLKKLGIEFTCYTASLEEAGMEVADDLVYARKAAKVLDLDLQEININLNQAEETIKTIIPLIESTNVVKVGVALPFYLCCERAKKDGIKVMFSGLGSEEIFAGYERHAQSGNINLECLSGLRKMYERDLYRDDVITMNNSVELRVPFLDKGLVSYALRIPAEFKLNNEHKKIILREIASEIGIPEEFSYRKKKAAQYGSKFDRGIEKLASKHGFKYKADYLNSFSHERNLKLGIMWSTGKDSCYAAYLMEKHNYDLTCLLTMKSDNKYSYMFHTPNVDIADLQAEAMELPLHTQETKGEKEDELKDMKKLLSKAKEKYQIDGVVTGALFSTYQRERIETVCDELGLKVFSPLWHKNQEQEMREIIHNDFSLMLSSIAADGLDESWVGRILTEKDVDSLVSLHKKIGFNIAGEGGEFESLVVDCPLFKKKLVIQESEIISEGKHNVFFVIKKALLEDK